MRKKFVESSNNVRNTYWTVNESILEQLEKPGLTSQEREYLANSIRENMSNWRNWEESNEKVTDKLSDNIGKLKGVGLAIGGLALGTVIGIAIKILRRL